MLKTQLSLTSLLLGLTFAFGAFASFRLLMELGLTPAAAGPASLMLVLARALALFTTEDRRRDGRLLFLLLGGWHVAAVGLWLSPTLPDAPSVAGLLPVAKSCLLAMLAALAIELAHRFGLQLAAPTISQALAADLAIARWFAQRRIDVERQLLEELARDARMDARLRHRIESIRRRFDQTFSTNP